LLIASSVSITVNGSIGAGGGIGVSGAGCSVVGGGGSGGAIRLMAPIISGTGSIGAGGGGGFSGYPGGSPGRIRLEAFQHLFPSNRTGPTANFVTPGIIFPPASTPSIRVVRVAGVAVPENSTGSFFMPDVTLDNVAAVVVEIEARNVPLGTVVQLTITPETGSQQMVVSSPLAGTEALSNATATVTLTHGFSRFSVQANWTP
jgi:hypothetical protein